MRTDEATRILNETGNMLAQDSEYPLDGTLLYAEVGDNWVSAAIFKLRKNDILCRWPSSDLTDPLLDLWELEDPDKRWAEMEYVIRDGKFTVTYTYAEDIDPNEDDFHRRDRIVWRHFGQLPIVYPPWPEDDDGTTFEL